MAKKKNNGYKPLRCHLLRAHVGGGISLFVETPTGHNIQGWLSHTHDIELHYDITTVPPGPGVPHFETADVVVLTPKSKPPKLTPATEPTDWYENPGNSGQVDL